MEILWAGPECKARLKGVPRALDLPAFLEVSTLFDVLLVGVHCTVPSDVLIGPQTLVPSPRLFSYWLYPSASPSSPLLFKQLHTVCSLEFSFLFSLSWIPSPFLVLNGDHEGDPLLQPFASLVCFLLRLACHFPRVASPLCESSTRSPLGS